MNLETYQKKIEALLNKAGKGKKVEKYLSERLQIGDNYLIYVKGNYKSVIAGLKASQSFTFDKEWESMRARKVSTFLFNPGNVLVNASEIKLNYFIKDPDSLRGRVRNKIKEHNIEFLVQPYQGMKKFEDLPPYPGKRTKAVSDTLFLAESIRDLIYFIRENGYSTCFPRYFQYNPLGADTRTVIFYEGEKKA